MQRFLNVDDARKVLLHMMLPPSDFPGLVLVSLPGESHRLHDGEGFRVEDVDGRGLGAEDEAADGRVVGVRLLERRDRSHDRLTLQRERAVRVDERLKRVCDAF